MRSERELESRLADHVVRRGRERRPRRAAEDEALAATLEQEGEVRAAALADPGDGGRAGAEPVLVQERLDPVERDEVAHQADWPPSTISVWPVT